MKPEYIIEHRYRACLESWSWVDGLSGCGYLFRFARPDRVQGESLRNEPDNLKFPNVEAAASTFMKMPDKLRENCTILSRQPDGSWMEVVA